MSLGLRVVVGVAVGQVNIPGVGRIVRFRSGRPVVAVAAGEFILAT